MRKLSMLMMAALSLGLINWAMAADDEASGKKVDRAVDNASNKVDRTADKVGDATRNAADKTRDKIGDIDLKTEKSPGQTADLPPGIQKATKDDSEDIRSALAKVTEAAMSKDFHEIREKLVDADRNRLKDLHKDDATYSGRIDQIRKDWKAKYNQEFDVPHKIAFGPDFKGFTIVQGEIANPALLSNWPVDNSKAKGTPGSDKPANADGRRDETNKPGNKPGDRNLEKGRNVAIVNFPEEHGTPEITASLIHELPDQWRFDIPDNVDSMKLYQNLLAHMTAFGDMKDQWPADVNEAYRLATHHVLEAIYDLPVKK